MSARFEPRQRQKNRSAHPLRATTERILPYDPSVSEPRNQWRQASFWAENSHFVGWHAATTHFLEISNLFPRFSEGVVSLAHSSLSVDDG